MILKCYASIYASNRKDTWEHQFIPIFDSKMGDKPYTEEEMRVKLVVMASMNGKDFKLAESDLIKRDGVGRITYLNITWLYYQGVIYNNKEAIEV